MRVLTGRAGTGKTRLALELCEDVREEWDAGFVRDLELRRFLGAQNLSTWGWQRPTLVVIDYAASHAEPLCGWLGELADYSGPASERLRLLLLERQANAGSGWWQTVFDPGGFGERGIERLLDPAKPVPIEPIGSGDARQIIERVLNQKATSGDAAGPAASEQQLAELTTNGEPLFLMMAAMVAADAGMANALSLGRTGLALELATRELRRVARFAGDDQNRQAVLRHLAAYVTLCRGLDREQAEMAAAQEKEAIGRGSAGDPAELTDLLATALSSGEGRIEPILPDMIGEAAILKAFESLDRRSAALVLRAFGQAGQPVGATIIRTAQDFAGAGHQAPLAWLDALIVREEIDLDQLMLLADTLPQTSFALLKHAARVTERITDRLREAVERGDAHRLPVLAAALNNLGVRLSAVGQREAALAPAQEAADLYRELAAKAPDAYRPDLAHGPQQPGQLLERGRPARGGARAGAGGGGSLPRAGGQGARCLSARSRHGPQQPGHSLERGRPARGGARAGAGGGRDLAASWRPRRPMPIGPISLLPSTTWPFA